MLMFIGGNEMYTIEKTRNALINRFENNGWKELELTLKTGDRVWITPCYYGEGTPSLDDIEYFLMNSDSVYLCGADNIDKIADTLNHFSDIKNEDESEKAELEKYFKENIEGHSEEEWRLGYALNKETWNNPKYSWETPLHDIAVDLSDKYGISVDKVESALILIENASIYSDWYKDVWGHRPRY